MMLTVCHLLLAPTLAEVMPELVLYGLLLPMNLLMVLDLPPVWQRLAEFRTCSSALLSLLQSVPRFLSLTSVPFATPTRPSTDVKDLPLSIHFFYRRLLQQSFGRSSYTASDTSCKHLEDCFLMNTSLHCCSAAF